MDKEAYKVYLKKKDESNRKKLEAFLDKVAKKEKVNLNGLPVVVNQRQFLRNLLRFYAPRTGRQIPQKVIVTALQAFPFTAPAVLLTNAVGSLQGKDDFYHPMYNTVNIKDPKKQDVLAHEVGHWLDFERGHRGMPYNSPWKMKYPQPLHSEINATLFAMRAAKIKKKRLNRMKKALATYMMWATPTLGKYKKEYNEMTGAGWFKKGDPKKFKVNLAKGLKSKTREERARAAMLTLHHLLKTKPPPSIWDIMKERQKNPSSDIDDLLKNIPSQYAALAGKILESELPHYGEED